MTQDTTPKMVRERIEKVWPSQFDGITLEAAKTGIQRMIDRHGPETEMSYQEDYDGELIFVLYKNRPETPDEVKTRLWLEGRKAEAQADWDRREYERLKALFGGAS